MRCTTSYLLELACAPLRPRTGLSASTPLPLRAAEAYTRKRAHATPVARFARVRRRDQRGKTPLVPAFVPNRLPNTPVLVPFQARFVVAISSPPPFSTGCHLPRPRVNSPRRPS